jgi:hypothetical protein
MALRVGRVETCSPSLATLIVCLFHQEKEKDLNANKKASEKERENLFERQKH